MQSNASKSPGETAVDFVHDSLTAPSFHDTTSKRPSSSTSKSFILPLEAWCLGLAMFPQKGNPTKHFLFWDERAAKISIRRDSIDGKEIEQFALNNDIKEASVRVCINKHLD